jgi:hypothetical protein
VASTESLLGANSVNKCVAGLVLAKKWLELWGSDIQIRPELVISFIKQIKPIFIAL